MTGQKLSEDTEVCHTHLLNFLLCTGVQLKWAQARAAVSCEWCSLCDSFKYHIKMGVNDPGPHFWTWGGAKELTPHCLVIACCNRNKQDSAFPWLIPLFTECSLPLWPLAACWVGLRGSELWVRDIVSNSSHFLQISGGKSPVQCGGRSVLQFRVGESFQVHKPSFCLCSLVAKFSLWGARSVTRFHTPGWQGDRNESNATNNIQEERRAHSKA